MERDRVFDMLADRLEEALAENERLSARVDELEQRERIRPPEHWQPHWSAPADQ